MIFLQYIKQQIIRKRLRNKGIHVDKAALVSKNALVGKGSSVHRFAAIGGDTELGENVRVGSYASISRIRAGNNTIIEHGVKCTGHGEGRIAIGKESYIGLMNILDFSNDITIGDYVHIAGPSTALWTHTSAPMAFKGIPASERDPESRPTAPIVVEHNVYIGGNCTVYPGVTIGHHSLVAPNSAVTKDVEPYTMVGGVPARFIKHLNRDAETEIRS